MRCTHDLRSWSNEVDVLIQPFHLSFPYVFEDGGKVYMLPETGGDKSISLYEAEDENLTRWHRVAKLKEDAEPWCDSLIFKFEGRYYLFSGHDNNVRQEQYLFVSDNLMGPYKKHPDAPIAEGRDRGRNAGCIIIHEGKIYRPVQGCMYSYGEQVSVMKIESISPTDYKESFYRKNIIDTSIKPYSLGGHQWTFVDFLNRRVVATDYKEKNYNIVEGLRRIKHLLHK